MLHTKNNTLWGILCYVPIFLLLFMNTAFAANAPLSINLSILSNYDGADISCYNACDGLAEVQINGGTPGYNILWSNGMTTTTNSNLCAGTYTVTVTDNGGTTLVDSIVLTAPATLIPIAAATSNYNGAHISCFGYMDGAVIAGATGGSHNYNYEWSNAQTTQTMSGLAAGNYTVTITDSRFCTATTSISLIEPAALSLNIAANTSVNCVDTSSGALQLGAIGGLPSYEFTVSNQLPNTSGSFTGLAVGFYQILVSDANGCSQVSAAAINNASPITINLALLQEIACNNGSDAIVTSSVTGIDSSQLTYSWNTGATTNNLFYVSSNAYHLTVTDAGGCTATNSIYVPEPDPIQSSYFGSRVSCPGANDGEISLDTTFGGTGPYLYSLSPCGPFGPIDSTWSHFGPGMYHVYTQDANGCVDTSSPVWIDYPTNYGLDAHESQTILVGETVQLYGSVVNPNIDSSIVSWAERDPQSGAIIHLFSGVDAMTGFETDTFHTSRQFILYLNNECHDSALVDIEVEFEEDIYIPNAFSPNGDAVNDIFTVFGSPNVGMVKELIIFDRWGELVFRKENFPPNSIAWDGSFNGRMMSMAVFMYQAIIEMNDGQIIVKTGDLSLLY